MTEDTEAKAVADPPPAPVWEPVLDFLALQRELSTLTGLERGLTHAESNQGVICLPHHDRGMYGVALDEPHRIIGAGDRYLWPHASAQHLLPGMVREPDGTMRSCTPAEYELFLRGVRGGSYTEREPWPVGYMYAQWGPGLLPLAERSEEIVAKLDASVRSLDARVHAVAPVYIIHCIIRDDTGVGGEYGLYTYPVRVPTSLLQFDESCRRARSLWAGPAYFVSVSLHGSMLPLALVVDAEGGFVASEACQNTTNLNHVQFHPKVNKATLYTWLAGPGEERHGRKKEVLRRSSHEAVDSALIELTQLANAWRGPWDGYGVPSILKSHTASAIRRQLAEYRKLKQPAVIVWHERDYNTTYISSGSSRESATETFALLRQSSVAYSLIRVYPAVCRKYRSYRYFCRHYGSVPAVVTTEPVMLAYHTYLSNIRQGELRRAAEETALYNQARGT